MKRISLFLIVVSWIIAFSGCTSTLPAPRLEEVPKPLTESAALTPSEPTVLEYSPKAELPTKEVAADEATVLESVGEVLVEYPFGVTSIVKNAAGDKDFDLFVVHTNDVHARITPSDGGMGYFKLATMLEVGRSITDNILLL